MQQDNSRKLLSKQPHINHMARNELEAIIEMLQKTAGGTFEQWKKTTSPKRPGGDQSLTDAMVRMTKGIRSMQSQSMQDQQQRNVRANIERRAELREKTSMKFPNIANLLTGGAPGPIGLMGQMQKQASKPFKGVYDYKKAQESSRGFAGNLSTWLLSHPKLSARK